MKHISEFIDEIVNKALQQVSFEELEKRADEEAEELMNKLKALENPRYFGPDSE